MLKLANYKLLKKIKYYKKAGITIGNNFRLFDVDNTFIDTQNPKLIKIGNNVMISRGVVILTHDYSWAVLANVYNRMYGNTGTVQIGNNVFIGMNTIILKNTKIGDNVIIGAGSIVSGELESNSVWCGNPAKKVMTLEEYNQKLINRQLHDVENNYNFIQKITQQEIHESDFFEYFYLYKNKKTLSNSEFNQINRLQNNKIMNLYTNEKKFKDFNDMKEKLHL